MFRHLTSAGGVQARAAALDSPRLRTRVQSLALAVPSASKFSFQFCCCFPWIFLAWRFCSRFAGVVARRVGTNQNASPHIRFFCTAVMVAAEAAVEAVVVVHLVLASASSTAVVAVPPQVPRAPLRPMQCCSLPSRLRHLPPSTARPPLLTQPLLSPSQRM